MNQLPGKFANKEVLSEDNKKKVIEELEKLPSLSENPTDKEYNQYFQYLYSISANDFPDPNDLVKKWEFSMFGSENLENPKYQFKENYNVEVILDSSGSMGAMVDGRSQMEAAKEAINEFVSTLPEEANISLRVYGHKGTGKDSDKAKSCSSIEQVYGFKGFNSEEFQAALNNFEPSGWTPIADSLKESFESFKQFDNNSNTNLIYLVSDGIETCDGDPVKVAKEFSDSNVSPIINVIGFNVDAEAQSQLKQVAESSEGIYTTVANKEQLTKEFNRTQEVLERWENWKQDALTNVENQNLDNKTDISEYSNDFNLVQDQQKLRINDLLSLLREKG
ncbi:hypothetical protein A6P54_20890 [Bacillus sp. MKU004]|nr:hypothetical protein A6P54_20890 [Bacillus sp. MKU004]